MQADLHYYITYIAARAAGWNKEHSLEIALAAHYVDCSGDPDDLKAPWDDHEPKLQKTITNVAVSFEAAQNLTVFSGMPLENQLIWSAFHFLPALDANPKARYDYCYDNRVWWRMFPEKPCEHCGAPINYGTTEGIRRRVLALTPADDDVYEPLVKPDLTALGKTKAPPTSFGNPFRAKGGNHEWKLAMRTFPYSPTIADMTAETEEIVQNNSPNFRLSMIDEFKKLKRADNPADSKKGEEYRLAIIGVRLHVLADAFSHAGFAGTTSSINMQKDTCILIDPTNINGPDLGLNWQTGDHSPLKALATGHAQMGAMPDMPGARYSFISPKVSEARIYKDNPTTYKYAAIEVKKFLETMKRAATWATGEGNAGTHKKFKDLFDKIVGAGEAAPAFLREAAFQFPHEDDRDTGFELVDARSWGPGNKNNKWQYNAGKADASLEKRCKYLYDEIGKIEGRSYDDWHDLLDMRKLEGHDEDQFKKDEQKHKILKESKKNKDSSTEYSIIRRVRLKYWDEKGSYLKLKAVDFAARWHHGWFKEKYGNLAEVSLDSVFTGVRTPLKAAKR